MQRELGMMDVSMLLLIFMVLSLAAIHAAYVLILLLHRRKHKSRDQSSLPAPPGPAGLPLIGNAVTFFGLLRHNPHRALARLAGTYGPIFSFRPGRTCAFVVLSSPELAREALTEKEAALGARFVPDSVRALAYGAGSMAFVPSSDPLWKRHRATAAAFITSGRGLTATRPVRDRHARQLAARLRACSGRPVRVGEAVFTAANNVISNVLFSEDVVRDDGDLERVVGALFGEWAKPNVSDAFPFLAPLDLFGSRRRTARNLARLYELFHGVIERRLAAAERRSDMLDAVLEPNAQYSQLTRSGIAKLFTDMFIGASETSNITVEWAMAHLLRQPETMEKLRAEIAASLGSKDFVEEGDLGELPYLDAVVKETLRLHPAVPVATREVAGGSGVSLGGFPVAAGTCVLINLWAIGRDPSAWPEPEAFVPERFLGLGGSPALSFRGSDFAYRPFGAGRRMCPGLDFAVRFVPLVLASMVHRIEWRMPEGMGPEDVDLSDHCTLVLKLAKPLLAVPVSMAA